MENTYCKFYENKDDAYFSMKRFNHNLTKKTHKYIRVMIDGPEDNYAVVDLNTAIEMNALYSWAF